MKNLLSTALALLLIFTASARAASDADVTLLKVKDVVIDEDAITIRVEEATTRITLISDKPDPANPKDQWHGMPVRRVVVVSDQATFTIKRDRTPGPDNKLDKFWQETVDTAKNLQAGKEVGRIGFYAPDIVIRGNKIVSVNGSGYLYPKGK